MRKVLNLSCRCVTFSTVLALLNAVLLDAADSPPGKMLKVVSATASSTETPTKQVMHLIDGSGLVESPAGSGIFLHTDNPYRFNGVE